MAIPVEPSKVRLFIGVIHSCNGVYMEVINLLQKLFGEIISVYGPEEFNHTSYYNKEMGTGLKRSILVFRELIDRGRLAEIKLKTNKIEKDFSDELANDKKIQRKINLDPGMIALENMILASCKGFAHRIYLSGGVYGDLTLIYRGNSYQTLPWTYPDYAQEKTIAFLNSERKKYKEEIGVKILNPEVFK